MKSHPILFDRLLFGPESIVRKHWFENDDLHLDVLAVGVQVGSGLGIRQADVSEVVFVFRGCSAWQRRTLLGRDLKVEKAQSDLRGTPPNIAMLPPQGYVVPAPRTGWNIVARLFECYMHEEDIQKVAAVEREAAGAS